MNLDIKSRNQVAKTKTGPCVQAIAFFFSIWRSSLGLLMCYPYMELSEGVAPLVGPSLNYVFILFASYLHQDQSFY